MVTGNAFLGGDAYKGSQATPGDSWDSTTNGDSSLSLCEFTSNGQWPRLKEGLASLEVACTLHFGVCV